MNWSVFSWLRLWTATDQPLRPMFRARLAPITARPVTPIWLFSLMSLTLPRAAPGSGPDRRRRDQRAGLFVLEPQVPTQLVVPVGAGMGEHGTPVPLQVEA